MPAPDAAALVRSNGTDPGTRDRPAVLFGKRTWTHAEFLAESIRFCNLFCRHRRPGAPFHIAVLLDNTPDYLFALGGAALSGATIVGANHTRRGGHLARDLRSTHCGMLITEPRHVPLIAPVVDDLGIDTRNRFVSRRFEDSDSPGKGSGDRDVGSDFGGDLTAALATSDTTDPGIEPGPDTQWALIFTSGTSDAPKAVICSQRRLMVTGTRMGMIMGLTADDVGYVSMPLFHSNALMVGWAPAFVLGATVGLARKFSASGFLPDVRHYGATYFNYTGKPLAYINATPERDDDADNTLRVAFGNEGSPGIVDVFSRRFGVEVIDSYGATEGGVAVDRAVETRDGALGVAGPAVRVVDHDGTECPPAVFDADGRLTNAAECVGEIVNTAGVGPFEGYYNNDEANEATTRFGWYWSGDLGYLDTDRYLYFAGRNADWIRVDGENFLARPIEEAVTRHPDVVQAVAFGVPDAQAGDQVMVALVLAEGASFDPEAFTTWLEAQEDIGPKWRPRYVRVLSDPPTTGTNKIVKRTLVHEKFRSDRTGGDPCYVRVRGDALYRAFSSIDEEALAAEFGRFGRTRFWDL